MSVFAVLVVLEYLHLQNVRDESVAIWITTSTGKGDLLPADGTIEGHGRKLNKIVLAGSRLKDDLGGRVRLVLVVIDEKADVADADPLDEVDGEPVRLRTVGPRRG